jgi:hypothetical protein|tara:strand:- start:707 stop:892 length:186 start_codon:yes stop_codon:yes gene_type:complete
MSEMGSAKGTFLHAERAARKHRESQWRSENIRIPARWWWASNEIFGTKEDLWKAIMVWVVP